MECVTDNAPPPSYLVLGWQCERWHSLPEPGALFEQDYYTIYRMSALINVHNAVYRAKHLTGRNIHKLTDPERLVLRHLMNKGILFRA